MGSRGNSARPGPGCYGGGAGLTLDFDGDGIKDVDDNCRLQPNPRQEPIIPDAGGAPCEPGGLSVDLILRGRMPVYSGRPPRVRLTWLVRNRGTAPAHAVVFRYPPPKGFSVAQVTQDGRGCSLTEGAYSCRIGDLEPDGRTVVEVLGERDAEAASTRHFGHVTSDTPESSTYENSDSVVTR